MQATRGPHAAPTRVFCVHPHPHGRQGPPTLVAPAGYPAPRPDLPAAPPAEGVWTVVPWTIWVPRRAEAALGGVPANVDCTSAPGVVTAAEFANMRTAVAAYNTHIQAAAAARGMAYFDVNPFLQAQLFSPSNPTGLIPAFPDVVPAFSGGSIGFGPLFTLDGVHPSSAANRVVADSVAATINRFYGPGGTCELKATLPVPVCAGPGNCPAP